MTRRPFYALRANAPESEEFTEPFYPQDPKCCPGCVGGSSIPTCQQRYGHSRLTMMMMTASDRISSGSRISTESSQFISTGSHYNRLYCPDEIDLKSWTNKHPEQWGPREVLDWIYCVADKCRITGIRGEMFNTRTGSELCRLSREQFATLEPDYGSLLYACLHKLLRHSNFLPPNLADVESPAYGDYATFSQNQNSTLAVTSPGRQPTAHNTIAPSQAEVAVKVNGTVYDIDLKESFVDIKAESGHCNRGKTYYSGPCPRSSIPSESSTEGHYVGPLQQMEPAVCDTGAPRLPSEESLEGANELTSWRRLPGMPRKLNYYSMNNEGEVSFCSSASRGHASKGNHLWEFVRDLLANPNFNPSLVRWEDQANGVFRFVRSEKVARLWGEKKNNKTMTYEKLSRAMRFCRSAGHFAELPKNDRFPKKLCFKFGPKALSWRNC